MIEKEDRQIKYVELQKGKAWVRADLIVAVTIVEDGGSVIHLLSGQSVEVGTPIADVMQAIVRCLGSGMGGGRPVIGYYNPTKQTFCEEKERGHTIPLTNVVREGDVVLGWKVPGTEDLFWVTAKAKEDDPDRYITKTEPLVELKD